MKAILVLLLAMASLVHGKTSPRQTFSRLISPPQIQAIQNSNRPVLILDVRTPDLYEQGHVPGAVNLDAWLAFNKENNYLLPSVEYMQTLFRNKGLNNGDLVIIYDQGVNFFAARILWALDVLGHHHTRLMDGGFDRWLKAGMQVATGKEKPVSSTGNFVPRLQPQFLASKFTARLAMDNPNILLLDVRPEEEYKGYSNPDNNPRTGHIPGAINMPWANSIEQNLTSGPFKPIDELRHLFKERLPRNQKIITYCQAGGHSALIYLLLQELGYDVAVYDGSWQEWSRDSNLPVQQE